MVAALAACSIVFQEIDPAFSKTLVDQAAALYVEVSSATNLGKYSDITLTGCRTASDPIDVRLLLSQCMRTARETFCNARMCIPCCLHRVILPRNAIVQTLTLTHADPATWPCTTT